MSLRPRWAALLWALIAFEAAGEGNLELQYANGLLSVRADQVPVKTLWQQIARLADIRLHLAEGVSEMPVSWSLSNVPVEEALVKLVRPNDFAIFYRPNHKKNQAARIADIFVFPPSSPALGGNDAITDMPEEPETGREAERLGRMIAGPGDLSQRRQAIADLATHNPPDAARGLEMALAVQEPELRREVVQALGEVYEDAPPTALGQIVIGDRDPQVRKAAVHALAGLGSEVARMFIQQAAKDQDENVREAARKALSEFIRR